CRVELVPRALHVDALELLRVAAKRVQRSEVEDGVTTRHRTLQPVAVTDVDEVFADLPALLAQETDDVRADEARRSRHVRAHEASLSAPAPRAARNRASRAGCPACPRAPTRAPRRTSRRRTRRP